MWSADKKVWRADLTKGTLIAVCCRFR